MPVSSATLRRCLAAITLGAAATTAVSTHAQHKLGPQQTSFKAPTIAAASDEAERAIKRFTYPAGWKAELWAAEPNVAHGVAFDVADDGRVFVAESFRAWRGVPDIRGIMDWLDEDLACKSVDDRLAMMQRHLKPDQMAGYYTNTERVRLLRDPQGTGKATVSTVFAENFASPLDGVAAGVLARGKDVFLPIFPMSGDSVTPTETASPTNAAASAMVMESASGSLGTTCTVWSSARMVDSTSPSVIAPR